MHLSTAPGSVGYILDTMSKKRFTGIPLTGKNSLFSTVLIASVNLVFSIIGYSSALTSAICGIYAVCLCPDPVLTLFSYHRHGDSH
ncbi:hypothetical protein [Thiothrix sp.]|jgi:hypothetical protein|uniref:hypothetical protein n=1 Tax=Thiothrix sp. TaxID=1032 RepID=UPI002579FE1D|nr:hypothetical protein [Thiothrix sp.]